MKRWIPLTLLALLLWPLIHVRPQGRIHLVSMEWDAVPEAEGYRVYRGSSPSTLSIVASLVTITSHSDLNVLEGQTYFYAVTAVRAGAESGFSNIVSATIPGGGGCGRS